MEVSASGTAYSETYGGALFDSLGAVVPGERRTETVYLRNTGDQAGFLRIVLEDVTFDDLDFANALTLQASVGTQAGIQTALSLAQPCWVLSEGAVLRPGESVRVDTNLVFGNLDGQMGQGATARFSLGIALSDTTPGSLSPTDCGSPDVSVPVLQGPRAATPRNPQSILDPSQTVPMPDAAEEPGDLPVLNLPGGLTIDPNTWNLGEQWLVLFLVGGLLGGGAWFAIVKRRRREEEPAGGEAAS
ncbi:MAG: hypothetical protein IR160_00760 [Salinibacterium sp.]|nr:hypothetical protein [Salinibacterium sp.]MBF0671098.1 hypothetical protein [Salinibacterium sp.]